MRVRRIFSFLLAGCVLVGLLALPAPVSADVRVYVPVPPPPVRVEVRSTRPGPRHVWIGGYHRWDGNAYVWVPGRWEPAPRARAVWVPGHWVKHRKGWYWMEGRWR